MSLLALFVPTICTKSHNVLTFVPNICTMTFIKKREKMTSPSLRKLESDLQVNKTTLHNWKTNRPKLYEFIIESYKDKELLKKNLELMIKQKDFLQKEINENTIRIH